MQTTFDNHIIPEAKAILENNASLSFQTLTDHTELAYQFEKQLDRIKAKFYSHADITTNRLTNLVEQLALVK